MIQTALTLLRKDLRLFARDRTALFFLLVLVAVLLRRFFGDWCSR